MTGVKFSVVIPAYNQARLVVETVRSVLNQQHPAHEIIVVNDGSSDATAETLKQFGDSIKVINQPNAGRCLARNAGIEQATGDYVALLDHDDLFYTNTLSLYDRIIREHNYPTMLHGSAQGFQGEPAKIVADEAELQVKSYPDFLSTYDYFSWIGCSGFVIKLDALRRVGGFFPHRFLFEDVDLCLRLGTASPFVKIFRPRTYLYRDLHEGSGTHSYEGNKEGISYLLQSEAEGRYPGGAARQKDRLRIVMQYVRSFMLSAAYCGDVGEAMRLYGSTFVRQIQLGKVKFLVGLPLLLGQGVCRKMLAVTKSRFTA